jgi:predicted metal-dependent peptidase
MSENKDKEERRLSKIKISIMRNPKFALWSGLMTVGKTRISETAPTAYTNGRDEVYGREFVKKLDDKELAFVMLHETLHKAYRHLYTWRKLWDIDAQLCNMAMDYVINLELKDLDKQQQTLAMPMEGNKVIGLVDERFRGMNTKQVFDILREENPNGGEGNGFDEHDFESAKELSEDEQKKLVKEIDQAIRQGIIARNKVAGKEAGGMSRELGELLAPQVDWREQLKEFVRSTCSAKDASSWRRVNRRFLSGDVYMPSLIGEKVAHLVIGIDTSGSIGVKELNTFLTEVRGIAQEVHPERVTLTYWDSTVAGVEEYEGGNVDTITESTKPNGGGGTDPRCLMKYMDEQKLEPDAIIMLTDGCIGTGEWGDEWKAPILWTICGGNQSYAPVGKTIHIKEN